MNVFPKKVSFIGTGAMGGAVLERLINTGFLNADSVLACDIDQVKLTEVEGRFGVRTSNDNVDAARFADAVVIAVPPRNVLDVLKEIRASLSDSQILVSLAALISTSLIEETLQMRIAVARVMPNIACLVGAGFNVYSFGRYMTPEGRKWTEEFLGALGVYRQIDEEKMEIYSILSAMGPTYFLPFVDNLIKFGENEGLSQEEARIAVASTLGGTAQLISQTRRPVEEIKNLIGTQPLQKRERELRTVLTEELSRTLQQMRSAKEKLDRTASRAGVKQ